MRQLTFSNSQVYTQRASGTYNDEFLSMATKNYDLMSDDMFDKVHDIVYQKVLNIQGSTGQDTTKAQDTMQILSNMLEYLDNDVLINNIKSILINI